MLKVNLSLHQVLFYPMIRRVFLPLKFRSFFPTDSARILIQKDFGKGMDVACNKITEESAPQSLHIGIFTADGFKIRLAGFR